MSEIKFLLIPLYNRMRVCVFTIIIHYPHNDCIDSVDDVKFKDKNQCPVEILNQTEEIC